MGAIAKGHKPEYPHSHIPTTFLIVFPVKLALGGISMHSLKIIPLSLLSLLFCHVSTLVSAVRLPVQARSVKRSVTSPGNRLGRRASVAGISTITNTHNAEYIANITLGGKSIPVMLDTGRCVQSVCRRARGPD